MFLLKRRTSASAIVLFFLSAAVHANDVSCQAQQPCGDNIDKYLIYLVFFIVIFGTLLSILVIRKSLPEAWSLADALSEDVELSATEEVKTTTDGTDTVTKKPLYDVAGKPLLVKEMKASSSRLIALIGMLVILFMYIGFGSLLLLDFGHTGKISHPDALSEIIKFLIAGMTLFAPYLVNKVSSLFQGLTSSK
ncbi:hypothetical protein FMJ22_01945 [Klebsiella michiganensis]|uniref:hypothetical protein n=1 Tax=Klebsiella michiganensis TaxID=1134687 RepID=UPI001CCE0492|nr:hypothetical protein [Klebsiella michiganensis]MBZ7390170.1 hypothetical protein [Klebsiella michiganensis]